MRRFLPELLCLLAVVIVSFVSLAFLPRLFLVKADCNCQGVGHNMGDQCMGFTDGGFGNTQMCKCACPPVDGGGGGGGGGGDGCIENESNGWSCPCRFPTTSCGACIGSCGIGYKVCGDGGCHPDYTASCNTGISCCTPTFPTCGAFSPPNPSTFPVTSVALNANAGTWGTGCPGNNNRVTYQVSSDNFATNLSLPANCTSTPAGNGCIAGLPAYDTTYKWRAVLNNGSNSVTCGPWTIITKSTPAWWQAVGGGDIYGVVVQSKIPDTATNKFIILN